MSLNEARDVVAQADSLWHEGKMYGVDEGDSATLAQAYERLKEHSAFSRQKSEYAHACYHYGKLLRAKENPAAAMQAFIDATHSHTQDYHILGRVYSNMGSICHLAGEFPLSYEMYEKSADMFLQNGDSLLYYYDLNNMAFELAEQGKKGETLALLNQIEYTCFDTYLIAKTWETRADAYLFAKQYDSAIYCATISMQSYGITMPTCAIIKAQSFYKLLEMDSALWYANILLTQPDASYQDRFNALYIVQHCDSSVCAESILELSSQREDIRYYEYEPQKEKLSQAVQLLEQDLNRKPDLRWLFALVGIVLFAGSCTILYYIWHKRNVHSRLIHDIGTKQKQKTQLEDSIIAMHTEISQLSEQQHKTHQQLLSNIEATCSTLRNSKDVLSELGWKDYTQMCTIIDRLFNNLANTLQKQNLSDREIRLCILVLIGGYSDKQMADILYYSYKTIRSTKRHIALKLRTTSADLRTFLIEKVIG